MKHGLNENTKVTLTFGQLRQLVKESSIKGINKHAVNGVYGNTGVKITIDNVVFKNFNEVEIGDIGLDGDNNVVVILKKGVVSDLTGDDYDAMKSGGWEDDWPIVKVQYFEDGVIVLHPYDESTWNGGGVLVPRNWGNIRNVKKVR